MLLCLFLIDISQGRDFPHFTGEKNTFCNLRYCVTELSGKNQDLNTCLLGSETYFTYNFCRKFSFSFHILDLLPGPWALSVGMMHMYDHLSLGTFQSHTSVILDFSIVLYYPRLCLNSLECSNPCEQCPFIQT